MKCEQFFPRPSNSNMKVVWVLDTLLNTSIPRQSLPMHTLVSSRWMIVELPLDRVMSLLARIQQVEVRSIESVPTAMHPGLPEHFRTHISGGLGEVYISYEEQSDTSKFTLLYPLNCLHDLVLEAFMDQKRNTHSKMSQMRGILWLGSIGELSVIVQQICISIDNCFHKYIPKK